MVMIRSLDVTFKHEDVQDDKPHVLYTHRNVFPETQKINKVPKKRCQDFFLLFKTHFFMLQSVPLCLASGLRIRSVARSSGAVVEATSWEAMRLSKM